MVNFWHQHSHAIVGNIRMKKFRIADERNYSSKVVVEWVEVVLRFRVVLISNIGLETATLN
jgi:hypothetical protein